MSIIYVEHLGHVEPANISKVWATGGHWNGSRRWVARKWGLWGKPYRDSDWAWFIKPCVYVRFVGKEYPTEIECETNGEAERIRDTIIGQLNAGKGDVERIVAAAVQRLDENRAWTPNDGDHNYNWMTYTMPAPARHPNILHSMPEDPTPLGGVHDCVQGFITSTGRFVGRKEAMGIAVAAGQVPVSKVTAPDLFSEDLW